MAANEPKGKLIGEQFIVGEALARRGGGIEIGYAVRCMYGANGIMPGWPFPAFAIARIEPFVERA